MLAPVITLKLQVLNDNKAYKYKAFTGNDGKSVPEGIALSAVGLFEDEQSGRTEVLVLKKSGVTLEDEIKSGNYEFSVPQNFLKRRIYGYECGFKKDNDTVTLKKIK